MVDLLAVGGPTLGAQTDWPRRWCHWRCRWDQLLVGQSSRKVYESARADECVDLKIHWENIRVAVGPSKGAVLGANDLHRALGVARSHLPEIGWRHRYSRLVRPLVEPES